MPSDLIILGQTIKPNSSALLKMDIARLLTRSKVEVPVIVERGRKPGPCLLLLAGIHGDEINGVEIVRQIVAKAWNKPESGTVICIPLLNVFGFINKTRYFPDGRDLNRVFPGSNNGSLASRFAHYVMSEIIPHVDYCIDFHTGGDQRFNWPHIRIGQNSTASLKLAKAFGVPFIIKAKSREKTFRESMVNRGKEVLLFEGGKSLFLNDDVTRFGVQGAINIMHNLGMRDFTKSINAQPESIVIDHSKWIRAKHSGMFRSYIKVGEFITKGTILGSMSDPFGHFEKTIKCGKDGYVLSINQSPLLNQGSALFHMGYL